MGFTTISLEGEIKKELSLIKGDLQWNYFFQNKILPLLRGENIFKQNEREPEEIKKQKSEKEIKKKQIEERTKAESLAEGLLRSGFLRQGGENE